MVKVGLSVVVRLAVSATQPWVAPPRLTGFLYDRLPTWRTVAISRIGEISFSRISIMRSVSDGTT